MRKNPPCGELVGEYFCRKRWHTERSGGGEEAVASLGHRRKWSIFHKESVIGRSDYILWSAQSKMKMQGPLWKNYGFRNGNGRTLSQTQSTFECGTLCNCPGHASVKLALGMIKEPNSLWINLTKSEFLPSRKGEWSGEGLKRRAGIRWYRTLWEGHCKEFGLGRNMVLIFTWS